MPMFRITPTCLVVLLSLAAHIAAQGPGEFPERGGPRTGDRPGGASRARFSRPVVALLSALDTDGDGKLSGGEIQAAAESLQKLDKNQDGKLSADEIGWPPRGPGFGPGFGGPGGGPGGRRGGGPFGGPPFGAGGRAGRSLSQRLMQRDANQDGQVTASELPASMHWLIREGDQNNDGAIDETESRALDEKIGKATSGPTSK